jgi:importin-9
VEAGLAIIGSQNEAILDCIDDEIDADRPKPINIEYILSDIVPNLITLNGSMILFVF